MSGRNTHKEEILKNINKRLIGKPKLIREYFLKRSIEKEPRTCETYIRKILNFADFLNADSRNFQKRIKEVDEDEIIRYLIKIGTTRTGKETSDSWKAVNWTALHDFFDFVAFKGIRDDNPLNGIKRPEIKDPVRQTHMTSSETQQVFENVESGTMRKSEKWKERDMAIFRIFLVTGIRLSALTEIDVSEYDLEKKMLQIIDKRRKYREVVLDDESAEILNMWLKKRKELLKDYKDPGALFISERRKRLSLGGVEYVVKKYTSILDKNITPHKLRSTYGVMIYESTKDINKVQQLMGHKQIATTQRYLAGLQTDPAEAANIVGSVLKSN